MTAQADIAAAHRVRQIRGTVRAKTIDSGSSSGTQGDSTTHTDRIRQALTAALAGDPSVDPAFLGSRKTSTKQQTAPTEYQVTCDG